MEAARQRIERLPVVRVGLPAGELRLRELGLLPGLFEKDVHEAGFFLGRAEIDAGLWRLWLALSRRRLHHLTQAAELRVEGGDGLAGAVDQGLTQRHGLLEMPDIELQTGDGVGQMIELRGRRRTARQDEAAPQEHPDGLGEIRRRVLAKDAQRARDAVQEALDRLQPLDRTILRLPGRDRLLDPQQLIAGLAQGGGEELGEIHVRRDDLIRRQGTVTCIGEQHGLDAEQLHGVGFEQVEVTAQVAAFEPIEALREPTHAHRQIAGLGIVQGRREPPQRPAELANGLAVELPAVTNRIEVLFELHELGERPDGEIRHGVIAFEPAGLIQGGREPRTAAPIADLQLVDHWRLDAALGEQPQELLDQGLAVGLWPSRGLLRQRLLYPIQMPHEGAGRGLGLEPPVAQRLTEDLGQAEDIREKPLFEVVVELAE